jgi:hypothetical protein
VIRRRQPGRDRGAFTAELAAGLPALMVLLYVALTAVRVVTAEGQCVAAAREAALAAARGETQLTTAIGPPGAVVEIGGDTEVVKARVSARIPMLGRGSMAFTVEGTAVAAREPETTAGTG